MPENQELNSELGLRVTPIDEGIEEQTEEGVEEGEKHGRQSWHDDSPSYCRATVGYSVGSFLTPQLWANLKGRELANRCDLETAETVAAAPSGIPRIRNNQQLLFSFLAPTGLSL